MSGSKSVALVGEIVTAEAAATVNLADLGKDYANGVIQDSKTLGRAMGAALSAYATNGYRLHVLACSALWHVATTGNAIHLQRLYDGLRTNDQSAFKLWLRRTFAIVGLGGEVPDGLAADMVTVAVENGAILAFKNGSFKVTKGHTSPEAVATANLIVTRLIEPDGKTDRRVFDRNNFAEIKTLSDVDVLKALLKAAGQVESTENRVIHISENTKSFLGKIVDDVTARLKQLTLAEG